MKKTLVEIGTAAGGVYKKELTDAELGRLFRQLREIRNELYEAGYEDQVKSLFA